MSFPEIGGRPAPARIAATGGRDSAPHGASSSISARSPVPHARVSRTIASGEWHGGANRPRGPSVHPGPSGEPAAERHAARVMLLPVRSDHQRVSRVGGGRQVPDPRRGHGRKRIQAAELPEIVGTGSVHPILQLTFDRCKLFRSLFADTSRIIRVAQVFQPARVLRPGEPCKSSARRSPVRLGEAPRMAGTRRPGTIGGRGPP